MSNLVADVARRMADRLDPVPRERRGHRSSASGHDVHGQECAAEVAEYITRTNNPAAPTCADSVFWAGGAVVYEHLPPADRRRVLELVPQMLGHLDGRPAQRRALRLLDWQVRTALAIVMDATGRHAASADLRRLSEITNAATARKARAVVEEIHRTSQKTSSTVAVASKAHDSVVWLASVWSDDVDTWLTDDLCDISSLVEVAIISLAALDKGQLSHLITALATAGLVLLTDLVTDHEKVLDPRR